jgi:hypothetical protein
MGWPEIERLFKVITGTRHQSEIVQSLAESTAAHSGIEGIEPGSFAC